LQPLQLSLEQQRWRLLRFVDAKRAATVYLRIEPVPAGPLPVQLDLLINCACHFSKRLVFGWWVPRTRHWEFVGLWPDGRCIV
jgi:hypothetical protein